MNRYTTTSVTILSSPLGNMEKTLRDFVENHGMMGKQRDGSRGTVLLLPN
jgi:hypothetical protein